MNALNFFTQTLKKASLTLLLLVLLNIVAWAQCNLIPRPQPVVLPTTAVGCQSSGLTPNLLLENLTSNCPTGVGVTFNLKIYDITGNVVIFDSNLSGGDAVGNTGSFPVINIGTLNIAGLQRKVRIQRFTSGVAQQFVDMNVVFQINLTCNNVTLNINDNISLSNPAIVPTSNCAIPGGILTITDNGTAPGDCSQAFYGSRLRTISSNNNATTSCSQTISFNKIDINNITAPTAIYTDPAGKGCNFGTADRHPSITGFPILQVNNTPLGDATSVMGTPRTFGNASVVYNDVLQGTSCIGRVVYRRTWTITDICAATAPRSFTQDIISQDNTAPFIAPLSNVTVNTTTNNCSVINYQVPLANVTDNCSLQSVSVAITNSSTAIVTTNGGTVASLAPGIYNLRYTATDNCGLVDVKDISLTIQDNTAPSITCSAKVVALNNMGVGNTSALFFVDQLNDNCGASTMTVEIKRMSAPNTAYSNTLSTTCADINNPFMVILRATDIYGNPNFCMTNVEVQDKLAPSFVNLGDTIVNCPVDTNYLKSLNPVVSDGCNYTLVKQIKNWTIANCQTGTFDLVYTAKDGVGNTSTLTRKVTVVNPNPFTAANVIRPKNITIKNFNGPIAFLEPEKLDTGAFAPAIPKWNYNGCDLIALSHQDNLFKVNGSDCCFKILRTWKVANCCMMNSANNGPKIIDEFTQTIVVEDNIAPVIKGLPPSITVSTVNCVGNVVLPQPTSIADCAGNLTVNSITLTTTMPGKVTLFNYNNVPQGTYLVTYNATDACGNIGTTNLTVVVRDNTAPKLVAMHGLSANLDSSTGSIMLSAKTFANTVGTTDNCTPFNQIVFAFSKDPNDVNIMFDCNSFIAFCDSATAAFPVSLWARDLAGNWSNVTTYIVISKANTVCSCSKNIAGAIVTNSGNKVQDVLVNITNNSVSITKPFTTNANGAFVMPNIVSGQNYTVTPKKIDDTKNGVSTADLVMISKHILGQQPFSNVYQWIAADINKNGSVSTADLVELRKLILGVNNMFSKNDSWRFVDKSYAFKNTQSPLNEAFPETKSVVGNSANTDFIAVKIGDLNNNATTGNSNGQASTRSDYNLELMINDMKCIANNTYEVAFKAKSLEDIAGYQFTLNFDKDNLEFISLKNADNGADADFGFAHLNKGVITTSWMNPTSLVFKPMETLFTVIFKAKTSEKLSKMIKLSSEYTTKEAYTHAGETMDIMLDFMGNTTSSEELSSSKFELYQNQSNPFRNKTTVTFDLPEASRGTLTVFDQQGRTILRIDDDFNKGKNDFTLEIPAAGLYFYRLDTPEYSATRRMIVLE